VPVLVVCAGDARDAGWWLASLGDQLIASEEASLGYGPGTLGLQASQAALMRARHGASSVARAALQAPMSGAQWRSSGASFAVVPRAALSAQVAQWTQSICGKPEEALRLLKAHLTEAQRAAAMPAWPMEAAGDALASEPQVLRIDGVAVAEVLSQFEALLSTTTAPSGVVLWSESSPFDGRFDADALWTLSERIAQAPVPVVAALSSDACGAAWAWSLGCDAAVHAEEARYGAGEDLFADARIAREAAWLWPERLGVSLGRELLLGGDAQTGAQLTQRSGGAVLAVPASSVLSQAQSVCALLSANGAAAVSSWKRERAAWREAALSSRPAWTSDAEMQTPAPGPLALESAVVSATVQADGVLLIELHDREAKNMFSEALVSGVREAFARASTSGCRVVVVTGTGSYFASGGTRESLLAIQSGEAKFTDYAIYGLPLTCEVPVIAAMQGHGIGAGWSLGMHADVVLHAEEGRYVSPYMSYGFTPGAGSTRMLPLWLGADLARESLLGGREYAGRELRERGLQGVHARVRVVEEALRLASSLARRPRGELVALKGQWATGLREAIARTYAQELSMHDRTFVGRAETRALIEDKFRRDDASMRAAEQRRAGIAPEALPELASVQGGRSDVSVRDVAASARTANIEAATADSGPTVEQRLRATLDAELHLQGHRIDADEQFIRIGLDSISAVTWMRRINQEFGTAFEATTLYSYPTLRELTAFLKTQVASAPVPARDEASVPVASMAAAVAPKIAPAAKRPLASHRPAQRVLLQPVQRGEKAAPAPAAVVDASRSILPRLRATLDAELHLQGRAIDQDEQFIQVGLDSISAVTWMRRINQEFGTAFEATTLYSYPTLRELGDFLGKHVKIEEPSPEMVDEPVAGSEAMSSAATPSSMMPALPVRAAVVPSRRRSAMPVKLHRNVPESAARDASPAEKRQEDHRIAIVGMSGRYPQADNLDAFWDNLLQGRDSIVQVPASRWDADRYFDPDSDRKDRMVSKWLGAMSDIDCFDPLFFRISPEEAEYMDPQHRLFLEESYRAFEDAGYAGRSLNNVRCGVYLGISTNEYAQILAQHGVRAAPVTGNSYSIAAARIAYYLNLKGPAISVDTACSSSLVALHLACQALRSGEVEMALAGGVSLWLVPESYLALSQAGMLSPDGRCKAFDDSANGIVMGDGVGALVLKRLRDAEADGDVIHGVIIGSGINQDGRTNGITAPSVVSQIELERSVHAKFGIDPATIGYVETHGTGTKLGDPIELEALATVFREKTDRKHYCALGSLKSNIGHASSAAGVAAMQKVLLSMRHRMLAPTLHVSKENGHFDFSKSPFYVNRMARPWSGIDGAPLRACVNSFGYSGTNAHVVVEAYAAPAESHGSAGEQAIPLSARNPERLRRKVEDLLGALASGGTRSIDAIAWTLQAGRDAMEHRVGFIVTSAEDLERRLRAWLEGDVSLALAASAAPNSGGGDARTMLAAWLAGEDVEWERLQGDLRPRRVHLPTYPFARERYWIGMQAEAAGDEFDDVVGDSGAGSLEWIEDILSKVESDRIAEDDAVALLRQWV
jgi:3-oxoacyl-(acyl-carrier-protein) synthase/enoyl-CoA hydratase/carnithine racemase/acyl carrier protein